MLTEKQNELLDSLGNGTRRVAPHLSELSEALSTAFGGPRALAETLRDLANDPKMPDWLRTRAYGIVVNTISAASKLADANAQANDVGLLSDDDLRREAVGIMREAIGIRDTMDADLATVVEAWSELPSTTRASMVATAKGNQ